MKKWWIAGCIWMVFIFTLFGCNNIPENLTRVDYKHIQAGGTHSDTEMVTDKKTLGKIERIFNKIKWKENVEVKKVRREDIKVTLFYEEEENMPEKLYEYDIWFHNEINKAVLIGDNDKQSYGMLNKELSLELQELLNYK